MRKFYKTLTIRNKRLNEIRNRLLLIKLKRALILYIKERRAKKIEIRKAILGKINLSRVRKIQGLIRMKLARKRCQFMKRIMHFRS